MQDIIGSAMFKKKTLSLLTYLTGFLYTQLKCLWNSATHSILRSIHTQQNLAPSPILGPILFCLRVHGPFSFRLWDPFALKLYSLLQNNIGTNTEDKLNFITCEQIFMFFFLHQI